jgi:NADH-quinone oxidoreductase subunit L
MFRLWFMTFFGTYKPDADLGDAHAAPVAHAAADHGHGDDHGHGGVHEAPWVMLAPLVILAIGTMVAGFVGVPDFLHGHNQFERFLAPVTESSSFQLTAEEFEKLKREGAMVKFQVTPPEAQEREHENVREEWTLAGTSVIAASLGLFFAWLFYYKRPELPDKITAKIHGVYLTVLHKYYVDEGYGALLVKPLMALSTVVFWRGIDQGVIDGLVNGAGATSKGIGNELRRMQSGNIRSYAAWVAIGGAAVIAYMVWLGVSK